MANIGDFEREVYVEPLENPVPQEAPAPATQPETEAPQPQEPVHARA